MCYRVRVREKVPFVYQFVNSAVLVIPPALPRLELARELPPHDLVRVDLVDHLYFVLVGLGLLDALDHLEEDGDMLPFGRPIAIRIDFQAPGDPVGLEDVRVDDFLGLFQLGVVAEFEDS